MDGTNRSLGHAKRRVNTAMLNSRPCRGQRARDASVSTRNTMAFITFLGHKKTAGVYRLSGSITVGRSLDCDVYVPDVYLSRHHCRFERHNGCWRVVDLASSNGVWCDGRQQPSVILKPGDLIEIGTIAVVFNEGDPERASTPAPFGMGFGAAELMDTICAEGFRPADYSRKQAARKAEFAMRVRQQLTQQEEEAEAATSLPAEPWTSDEWTELDLEADITAAQEVMYDWQPPIFNPPRRSALANPAGDVAATAPAVVAAPRTAAGTGMSAGVDLGSAARPTNVANVDYSLQPGIPPSAKRSAPSHSPEPYGREAHSPATQRQSILARVTSWLPLRRKRPPAVTTLDGCVFERATWWDGFKDSIAERTASSVRFAKLNPAIAGAIILMIVVGVGAAIRFSPAGKRGPHIYVPPPSQAIAFKKTAAASE